MFCLLVMSTSIISGVCVYNVSQSIHSKPTPSSIQFKSVYTDIVHKHFDFRRKPVCVNSRLSHRFRRLYVVLRRCLDRGIACVLPFIRMRGTHSKMDFMTLYALPTKIGAKWIIYFGRHLSYFAYAHKWHGTRLPPSNGQPLRTRACGMWQCVSIARILWSVV